ncbi:MAG: preprotein translocase subunit SecE [Syntrophomonadaceae bacterium]|nr:preprotein translocase subunit SecE [Syntrophomonadaceae bacterium]
MILAKNNVPAKSTAHVTGRWESAKRYVSSVYNELKKVHWPNRTQLLAYTGVVLFSIALVGLIIWLFDFGLSFLLEKLFQVFA